MNTTSAGNITLENANGSSTTIVRSKTEGIALCSAFMLVSVLIVVGNLLIILLFAVNRRLRKRSLFLVINIAFADLMLGTLTVPIYIFDVGFFYDLWKGEILSNRSFFISHTVTDTVFGQASLISAPVIAGERFHAIYWPFKNRTLSMRAYRIVIGMVWTLALFISTVIMALYHLISTKRAVYAWTPYALTLTFIICGCNIGIWRKFQHGSFASHQQNRASQNTRVTKTLLLVSILAPLTWLPLIILNVLYVRNISTSRRTYVVANLLNYSNSFVNPIVYTLRISEFRRALGLCFFNRQTALNRAAITRRNNRIVSLTPVIQLKTLRTDPSHPKTGV